MLTWMSNMKMDFSWSTAVSLVFVALLALVNAVGATPAPNYPINSQLPPVARVSQPFNFTFSSDTFTNSDAGLQYSLSNAPSWLKIDSNTQTLHGTPGTADVGAPQFLLVAADQSGSGSMSVTLVVSSDPGPETGKSLLPQLAKTGPTSSPATVFMYPGRAFTIDFGDAGVFTNTNANTIFYATSTPYNSPLPSWISFDPSQLTFSGNSPSNPSSVPQSFNFNLIASDAAGFSAAMVTFEIVVSQHILAFSKPAQTLNFTLGQPFSTPHFIDDLSLDNRSVASSNLSHFGIEGPSWLNLDNATLSLSGTAPPDAGNENVTITVGDIYDDMARLELNLRVSQLFAEGVESCNATIGETFTYKFDKALLSDDSVQLHVDLGAVSSWAQYDSATETLTGDVPKDLTPQTFAINLTATQGPVKETRNLDLNVNRSGKGDVNNNQTSSGTNHGMSKKKVGIIVAAVLAPIIAAAIIGALLFMWCRRRRSKASTPKHENDHENASLEGKLEATRNVHPEKNGAIAEVTEISRNSSNSSNDSAPPQLELGPLWETASLENEQIHRPQSSSIDTQPQKLIMEWDRASARANKYQAPSQVSTTRSPSVSQSSSLPRQGSRRYSKREPLKPIQPRSLKRDSLMSSKSKRYSRRSSGLTTVASGLPVRLSGAGHGAGGIGPPRSDLVRASWHTTQMSLQSDDTSIENLATMFPRPPHVRNRDGSISTRRSRGGYQKRTSLTASRPLSTEPPEPDSLEAFIQGRARNRNSGNPLFSSRMNSRGSTGYRALDKARRSSSIADTAVSVSTYADDRRQSQARPVSAAMSASVYGDDRNSMIQTRPMSQISEMDGFTANRNRTSQGLVQRYTDAIAELPRFWSQGSIGSTRRFESAESLTESDNYYDLIDEREDPEGRRQWYRVNSQTQPLSRVNEVVDADPAVVENDEELPPVADTENSRVRRMSLLRTGGQDSSPTAARHWRLADTQQRRPSIERSDSLQPTTNSSFRGDLAFV